MLVNVTELVAGRPSPLPHLPDASAGPVAGIAPLPDTPLERELVAPLPEERAETPALVTWLVSAPREPGAGTVPRGAPPLTTDAGLALVDGIAAAGAQALRLGGAPLARLDLFEFVAQARLHDLPVSVVTSGAWVTNAAVERLRAYAVDDVHVELGAPNALHASTTRDGAPALGGSAVRAAVAAYHRCQAVGQRVALAVPLTAAVADALDAVFDFAELQHIERLWFYRQPAATSLDGAPALGLLGARVAVGTILRRTRRALDHGRPLYVMLADDFAAGPYALSLLALEEPHRALRALPHFTRSARRAVRAPQATVLPDGTVVLDVLDPVRSAIGSVRETPFDALWVAHREVLAALEIERADAPAYPSHRCPPCQWVDVCGVHDRATGTTDSPGARAISQACYLTDEEVGLTGLRLRDASL